MESLRVCVSTCGMRITEPALPAFLRSGIGKYKANREARNRCFVMVTACRGRHTKAERVCGWATFEPNRQAGVDGSWNRFGAVRAPARCLWVEEVGGAGKGRCQGREGGSHQPSTPSWSSPALSLAGPWKVLPWTEICHLPHPGVTLLTSGRKT